jgi:EAL domain-containing protein (putative c-di-GMP-specific phosphodiesterase class I)
MQVLGVLQKPFTIDDVREVVSRYEKPRDRAQRSGESVEADDLLAAIKERQLYLVYQPQVDAIDFETVGLETLVRWEHPEKGFISPGEFVPLAEQAGLIKELDSFVFETAVTQFGKWKKQGYGLSMSVNVSPASITDLDLPERLVALTASQGVEPSDITLEVTETAVMSDVGKFMDVLTRARMRGFGLAIDDFGTGYSSLQQLVRLPFTEMKIDLSFVIPILRDRECRAVSHAAIMLGHELGMDVVAEGVESQEIAELLKNMGADNLQGYHLSKPLKADDLEKFMVTKI